MDSLSPEVIKQYSGNLLSFVTVFILYMIYKCVNDGNHCCNSKCRMGSEDGCCFIGVQSEDTPPASPIRKESQDLERPETPPPMDLDSPRIVDEIKEMVLKQIDDALIEKSMTRE